MTGSSDMFFSMHQLLDHFFCYSMDTPLTIGLKLCDIAASNGVIMFALPPHTTHIAQPLDVTSFHVLKTCWDQECNKYMAENPEKVVMVYQFSQLFAAAYKLTMTRENIVSGFKKSGIYPLNKYAIAIPGEEPAQKSVPPLALDLAKKSGITFSP